VIAKVTVGVEENVLSIMTGNIRVSDTCIIWLGSMTRRSKL